MLWLSHTHFAFNQWLSIGLEIKFTCRASKKITLPSPLSAVFVRCIRVISGHLFQRRVQSDSDAFTFGHSPFRLFPFSPSHRPPHLIPAGGFILTECLCVIVPGYFPPPHFKRSTGTSEEMPGHR